MKRLCRRNGHGDGVGMGRSINDLPEELLENILWRIKRAPEAAACAMVCRVWEQIICKCPVLEFQFAFGEWDVVRVPRAEAIIGSMLMQRQGYLRLRELSINFEHLNTRLPNLSEDRVVKWYLPLAYHVEVLRISILGLNLTKCLRLPYLKKLLVSHSSLRKMPRSLPRNAGKNLRFCSLDFVVFYSPLAVLLSACPSLEALILNECRIPSLPGTEISSQSLRRIYIVNDKWEWIFLDAPKLDLLAIKSYTMDLVISVSKQTQIQCGILMSPVKLQCKISSLILAGDEWTSRTYPIPGMPPMKLMKACAMEAEIWEEMVAWLEKFNQDLRVFEGDLRPVLNITVETRGLQSSGLISLHVSSDERDSSNSVLYFALIA